jgi:hypothetical protein
LSSLHFELDNAVVFVLGVDNAVVFVFGFANVVVFVFWA